MTELIYGNKVYLRPMLIFRGGIRSVSFRGETIQE